MSMGLNSYHEYAKDEPILDFHNHLSPEEISIDRRFSNLAEIWLECDHYKWRALRANGIPEELITGNGDAKEKYLAWAKQFLIPLGNPLYHWTHLELKRCFDIDTSPFPGNCRRNLGTSKQEISGIKFFGQGVN